MFKTSLHSQDLRTLSRGFLQKIIDSAKTDGINQIASLVFDLNHWEDLKLVQSFSETNIPFLYHHNSESTHLFVGQLLKHTSSGRAPRFEEAEVFFNSKKKIYTSQSIAYSMHVGCGFNFLEDSHAASLECFVPKWHFCKTFNQNLLSFYYLIDTEANLESCEAKLEEDLSFLLGLKDPEPSPITLLSLSHSSLSAYKDTVAKALHFLEETSYKKITLGAYQDYTLEGSVDFLSLFQKLKIEEPQATLFYFSAGPHHSFFGASPESLVRIQDKTVFVDALAGSSLRLDTINRAHEEEKLLQDKKILQEHRYVVDAILDALKSLGLDPICPKGPCVKTLKHLYHLFTPIQAKINSTYSVFKLIQALHPTPALGTYPKKKDYSCVQKLEGFDRKLYGGGLGWINTQGDGHITVNIRCAQLQNDCLRFFAGCGLTRDSVPELELVELQTKLKTLLKHFRFQEEGKTDHSPTHTTFKKKAII